MRPPSRFLPALVAALGTTVLGGCDAAIAGFFLPGLGRPLTGRVLDAYTHLPVGGATVLAGLGATVTDAEGRFNLIGNFGGREVSVARAGYIALTLGGLSPDPGGELLFEIEPLFPANAQLPKRFLTLFGEFGGLPANAPAIVALGGLTPVPVSNGAYNLEFSGSVPGRVLSSVLAWGSLSAPYVEGALASQAFHFLSFNYMVGSWPLGETVPESRVRQPLGLAAQSQVPIKDVKVAYTNLGTAEGVQTDVALDFGVLGYVPVARALASSQTLKVPVLEGLKYQVSGEARYPGGKAISLVTLTTNDIGKAAFPLLAVPKVTSPPATGAGARPTFAWTPVEGEVNYEIEVREEGEGKPKWIARTDQPEIQYPGFAPNDINGGALRPEKKYTWTLRAIDLLAVDEVGDEAARKFQLLSTTALGPVPIKPYRVRKREAMVFENRFGL